MLAVEDLTFSYGAVRVLNEVSLSVPRGRITCVMGRNGVGKTTLMKNVMGLLKAESGKVFLDGRDVTSLSGNRRACEGIALVPQGRQIFPRLTVEENLQVGMQARSVVRGKVPEFVYDMFPVLKEMTRRKGGDLSGGQQQQLAISRALVGEPQVLLLDEPTEGIQPNIIQQIGETLRQLVDDTGLTVVLVEQYLDFVREFGDQFSLMDRGRVVAQGETGDLTKEIVQAHLTV
ncbi:MAG: urea ABC transporter ATP-binding subunit UrtE [Planctomycetota bacterium]|nr:urea ABC transporter ATP-binding subunit UrtE [Planctomycetota bacterium]